jgi:hypothetical protein
MKPFRISLYLLFTSVLLLLALSDYSIAQENITASPKVVVLKRIWMLLGRYDRSYNDQNIGMASGSVGDINGDGLGDFAVCSANPSQWSLYLGDSLGPKMTPYWTTAGGSIRPPISGDFWGTGHRAVGFLRSMLVGSSWAGYELSLYRTDHGRIDDSAAARWRSWIGDGDTLGLQIYVDQACASDLDNDGADDLIVSCYGLLANGQYDPYPQLWIFKGGPAFNLNTPTVILRLAVPRSDAMYSYPVNLGDIDGDGFIDIVTVNQPAHDQYTMNVYWGGRDRLASATLPDRTVAFPYEHLALLDADGDGIKDVATGGVLLYLSGRGKTARSRTYAASDADLVFNGVESTYGYGLTAGGYMNDKRYESLMVLAKGWDSNLPALHLLTGGPNGPDRWYDGVVAIGESGLRFRSSIGDVNGDGWDDFLCSGFDRFGVAFVIAGGPYVPH